MIKFSNKLCMELSNSTSDAELKELFKCFSDEQLKEYLSDWKWYSNLSEDYFDLERYLEQIENELKQLKLENLDLIQDNKTLHSYLMKYYERNL